MRYVDTPTVISMERDYFSWNTTFPTATICPHNKTNTVRLERFVESSNATNKTALREFLSGLAEAGYDSFDKVTFYDGIEAKDYMEVLMGLQIDFKPQITCPDVKDGMKCELQRTITEMGVCYSFNSQLAVYNSPEYRNEGTWKLLEGRETLEVNPLDGDIFVSIVNMSCGYDVSTPILIHFYLINKQLYLHGSYEIPDVATKMLRLQNGYYLQVYLSALSIFSTNRVKRLMTRQRKCKYYDESDLKHSPVYSYVSCRIECRIKLAKKLCGCIPHFYKILGGIKICYFVIIKFRLISRW